MMLKNERLRILLEHLLAALTFWRWLCPARRRDQLLKLMDGRFHADQLHLFYAFHLLDGRVHLAVEMLVDF
jgi:hypothetical protein